LKTCSIIVINLYIPGALGVKKWGGGIPQLLLVRRPWNRWLISLLPLACRRLSPKAATAHWLAEIRCIMSLTR